MPFIRKLHILSRQKLISMRTKEKNMVFWGLPYTGIFHFTISRKLLWWAVSPLYPNQTFSLPEIHGSSPTRAAENYLFIIFTMHGCVSIHQISSGPKAGNWYSRKLLKRKLEFITLQSKEYANLALCWQFKELYLWCGSYRPAASSIYSAEKIHKVWWSDCL